MRRLYRIGVLATTAVTICGMILLLVEAFWISYGVFARYVLNAPDRFVTEGSALLLVPLAFVGLPFALRADAFPKVTLLLEKTPPRIGTFLKRMNLLLMILIGGFYALVAGSAAVRTFSSRASTDTLNWPEFVFWIPVAVMLGVFTFLGAVTFVVGEVPELEPKDR